MFRGRLARRIMLVLLPFIIIPVLIMGYAAYRRAQNLLIEQATQQIQALAEVTLNDLQAWLRTKQVRLSLALYHTDTQALLEKILHTSRFAPDFPRQRKRLLAALQRANRNASLLLFNEFLVVNEQGVVLVSTHPELEGLDLSLAPWWPRLTPVLQGEQSFVHFGSAHLNPLLPKNTFGVLTATRGVTPTTQGVLIIGVSKGYPIERFLQTTSLPLAATKGYFITTDAEWIHIDPLKEELVTQPLPESIRPNFHVLLARPTLKQFVTLRYAWPEADRPLLSVAGWLPLLQAGVGIEVSQGAILANITSLVPFTVGLLTLTTLFLALVIWLLTQNITRPVQAIARVAEAFASGDFRARAPIQRHDELGMLAYTFNQMADQLTNLTRSLEQEVEERTQQIQAAAEVATLATSATSLDDILQRTVNLIVERFAQYYHASVFLLDESGEYAVLRESTGPVGEEMKRRGHRLEVGGHSLVGWAAAHNRPRIASDVVEDPIHFKNPLLPETRSEAAIPIAVGPRVLGVLDVQSKNPYAFDEHAVATLQTLARQLAAAIYNARLLETTRIDLVATQTLYQTSRRVAQAQTLDEIFQALEEAFRQGEVNAALFFAETESDALRMVFAHSSIQGLSLQRDALTTLFPSQEPILLQREAFARLPQPLQTLLRAWRGYSAALFPLIREGEPVGLLLLATDREHPLTRPRIQPYVNLAEVVSNTLTKIHALQRAESRLVELEAINRLSQAMSHAAHLEELYPTLARELRRLYGEVTVALVEYDPLRQQLRIPFVWEQRADKPHSIPEPTPLGEGLTSLLIQKQEPLLITQSDEIEKLGAKHIGPPARSWMGAPLIVGDEILGALLVQDIEHEGRFTAEDFQTFITLSTQVALTIRNIRLLELSQRRAEQQQRLLEIGERLRRTIDLRAILDITAKELRQALQARRVMVRFYGLSPEQTGTSSAGNGHKE